MRLWQANDRRIVSLSCSDCDSHIFRCPTVCFCRGEDRDHAYTGRSSSCSSDGTARGGMTMKIWYQSTGENPRSMEDPL